MTHDAISVEAIEPLLRIEKVAELTGVDRATVYRWIRTGKLTVVRLGGRTLVAPDDLRALIAASRRTAEQGP